MAARCRATGPAPGAAALRGPTSKADRSRGADRRGAEPPGIRRSICYFALMEAAARHLLRFDERTGPFDDKPALPTTSGGSISRMH
jgi:hypothetical protein